MLETLVSDDGLIDLPTDFQKLLDELRVPTEARTDSRHSGRRKKSPTRHLKGRAGRAERVATYTPLGYMLSVSRVPTGGSFGSKGHVPRLLSSAYWRSGRSPPVSLYRVCRSTRWV